MHECLQYSNEINTFEPNKTQNMACIYSDRDGKCTLRDEDDDQHYSTSAIGWDKEGDCCVEDDPWPFDNCESFEPTDPSEYEEEED